MFGLIFRTRKLLMPLWMRLDPQLFLIKIDVDAANWMTQTLGLFDVDKACFGFRRCHAFFFLSCCLDMLYDFMRRDKSVRFHFERKKEATRVE